LRPRERPAVVEAPETESEPELTPAQ
jgi:hypothetical protein